MSMTIEILHCKGRWQGAGLTEGCPAIDKVKPLRQSFGLPPFPTGEDLA